MTTDRSFRFRLQSCHSAPGCTSTDRAVKWLNGEGEWQPQHLDLTMPGFRLYLISLFLCQHVYLVANARERQMALARVDAELSDIQERMKACPVSRNLPAEVEKITSLRIT
jgi:hypothetical protein